MPDVWEAMLSKITQTKKMSQKKIGVKTQASLQFGIILLVFILEYNIYDSLH